MRAWWPAWALSPTGVSISNLAFHTPNVFWKMFWSAPLLILLGLIGLQLRQSERSGLWEKLGFFVAVVGLVLIIAGDIGLYWLGIDDRFIVTAPAYNAFRIGLLVLAVGSILFAVTTPARALPTWGLLPFVLGSMCGLISFSRDLAPSAPCFGPCSVSGGVVGTRSWSRLLLFLKRDVPPAMVSP